MPQSEKELLESARRFDQSALTEIYDRYNPQLYAYAMRLLADEQLAEDCIAETFVRFLKAIDAGGGPQDYLKAYLYRTAHNWICDYFRRTPDWIELEDELVEFSNPTTEEHIEQNLIAGEMRSALRHLTEEQRQVVVLRYFDGWSNAAISQVLEKPVGAVKALQHRALRTLERLLLNEERQEGDVPRS